MPSSLHVIAGLLAATTGGLRGLLTVLGTLVFVGACFGLVEAIDRGRSPATAPGRTKGADLTSVTPGHDLFEPVPGRTHVAVLGSAGGRPAFVAAAGALGSLAVALALVPVREQVGQASVALSLVLVVVAAAAGGGRVAAAGTSASAALVFNFLHAAPRYSFHLRTTADVMTSVAMVLVGVAVGEVAVRRVRTTRWGDPVPQGGNDE
jgi:hypothetical protein